MLCFSLWCSYISFLFLPLFWCLIRNIAHDCVSSEKSLKSKNLGFGVREGVLCFLYPKHYIYDIDVYVLPLNEKIPSSYVLCEIIMYSLRHDWSKLTVWLWFLLLHFFLLNQKYIALLKIELGFLRDLEGCFLSWHHLRKMLSPLRRKWFQRNFCQANLENLQIFLYFIIYKPTATLQLFLWSITFSSFHWIFFLLILPLFPK